MRGFLVKDDDWSKKIENMEDYEAEALHGRHLGPQVTPKSGVKFLFSDPPHLSEKATKAAGRTYYERASLQAFVQSLLFDVGQ